MSTVTNEMIKIEAGEIAAMNALLYFAYNFKRDFIEDCFHDDARMAEHFRSKFDGYYKTNGALEAPMRLAMSMSGSYRIKLFAYILQNHKEL